MPSEYSKVTKFPFYASFYLESTEPASGLKSLRHADCRIVLPTTSFPTATSNVSVLIPRRKYAILIQDFRYLPP